MTDPVVFQLVGLAELFDLQTLLGILIEGVAKGGLYVMIAIGLTLIFGLMGVLNFAHGSFAMIGAYVGGAAILALTTQATGNVGALGVFFATFLGVFLLLSILGGVLEISLIRKLYDYPPIYQILLTFGLTLILDEGMAMIVEYFDVNGGQYRFIWNAPIGRIPPALEGAVDLGIVSIRGLYLLEIALGVATVVAVWLFLTRTRYGLFVRAGAEDPEMAEALGIDVSQTFTVVFAIGAGIAGAAGVILMWDQVYGASVPLALEVLLPAFVIVIVGGLGSVKGSIVAAYLVGLVDAFMTWVFRTGIVDFVGLPEMMIFLVLVIMLIVRPQGLYGVEGAGEH